MRDQSKRQGALGYQLRLIIVNLHPLKGVDLGIDTPADLNFSKEEIKEPSRNQGSQKVHLACSNPGPYDRQSNAVPLNQLLQLPKLPQIFPIYTITLLMYTVACPDPDPNHRGEGGQLPHPNECNSTLTSGISGAAAPT